MIDDEVYMGPMQFVFALVLWVGTTYFLVNCMDMSNNSSPTDANSWAVHFSLFVCATSEIIKYLFKSSFEMIRYNYIINAICDCIYIRGHEMQISFMYYFISFLQEIVSIFTILQYLNGYKKYSDPPTTMIQ